MNRSTAQTEGTWGSRRWRKVHSERYKREFWVDDTTGDRTWKDPTGVSHGNTDTSAPTEKKRKQMFLIEELINAVFVDRERVVTSEEGCEIWSLPAEGEVYWDGASTTRLVIQPQWHQLYTELIGGAWTYVLLEGMAGRGKSVFLRYVIIRMLEDPVVPEAATIAYVVRETATKSLTFWIVKNGTSAGSTVDVIQDIPKRPTYLFLDCVDSNLSMRAQKLNLGVNSGDGAVLRSFQKRVAEARQHGRYCVLLAPDVTAMRLMFPDISPADLQFRFDVLGGNPRKFCCPEPASLSEEIVQLVIPVLQDCLTMCFGDAYDHELGTAEGRRARWVMRVIAQEVERCEHSDGSLFRAEFATDNGKCQTRFASNFLRLVAAALDAQNDATLRDDAKKIAGPFCVGYANLYLSHEAFLAGDPETITFGLNPTGAVVQLTAGLYGRPVALVRGISDLASLRSSNSYGLPTLSTFHAVDAIVNTNLLQMHIPGKHGGAVDHLPDIAAALGVAVSDLRLIFVVESVERALTFQFPVMPGVSMLVTPRGVCTEQELITPLLTTA